MCRGLEEAGGSDPEVRRGLGRPEEEQRGLGRPEEGAEDAAGPREAGGGNRGCAGA